MRGEVRADFCHIGRKVLRNQIHRSFSSNGDALLPTRSRLTLQKMLSHSSRALARLSMQASAKSLKRSPLIRRLATGVDEAQKVKRLSELEIPGNMLIYRRTRQNLIKSPPFLMVSAWPRKRSLDRSQASAYILMQGRDMKVRNYRVSVI